MFSRNSDNSGAGLLSLLILALSAILFTIAVGSAHAVKASDYQTLEWDDLVPPGSQFTLDPNLIEHESLLFEMPPQISAPVVGKLNDKKVRIPGFAVPLEGDEKGITEFLLVPYMGACIHVPPPPTNQIVYVETKDKPLSIDLIYDAFWVSGTLSVMGKTSQYAETGYSMTADDFEIYDYN